MTHETKPRDITCHRTINFPQHWESDELNVCAFWHPRICAFSRQHFMSLFPRVYEINNDICWGKKKHMLDLQGIISDKKLHVHIYTLWVYIYIVLQTLLTTHNKGTEVEEEERWWGWLWCSLGYFVLESIHSSVYFLLHFNSNNLCSRSITVALDL